MPVRLSTDRLLSLANAGHPLRLSCRRLAAVACLSTSTALLSTDFFRPLISSSGCPVGRSLLLFVHFRRVYWCVLLPAQLSTDRLLSLANAGCPLRLAVLLLAAVCRSPPFCPLVLLPAQLSTDRLLWLANAGRPLRLSCRLLAAVVCPHLPLGSLLFALACDHCLLRLAVLLLAAVVRPPPPSGSLLIACFRLPTLSSPFVLLVTAVVRRHPSFYWCR